MRAAACRFIRRLRAAARKIHERVLLSGAATGNHDAQVRTSDGVDLYVKVWYSAFALETGGRLSNRQGNVPDGAMLVKEQYVSLTAALHEWTIMVKDSTGLWDGWYWADLSAPSTKLKCRLHLAPNPRFRS